MVWRLLSTFQNHKEDCAHFCDLFRKAKFYYIVFYQAQPNPGKAPLKYVYRTRAIITRGLFTFYPLFEVQKTFFQGVLFLKILALCMISIQERVL